MNFAKRIFLFLAVNILVVTTISLILNLLHVGPFLNAHGLNYESLAIFCLVWGMGGAFISLSLSRIMAKWLMGVKVIDPDTHSVSEQKLLDTVYNLCRSAGLHTMPQVGIYNSPEVNAFATGPMRSRSLVAVSSGLLNRMSEKELEGVLAHEVAHIINGDMVTMTLLQGVINAFVMFLARVLAFVCSAKGGQGKERSVSGSYYAFVFLFEILFMILGSLVIAFYSRFREFRADKGGAFLAGKDKMIAALESLERTVNIHDKAAEKPAFQAFKISTTKGRGILALFATHPPLAERIERLKSY